MMLASRSEYSFSMHFLCFSWQSYSWPHIIAFMCVVFILQTVHSLTKKLQELEQPSTSALHTTGTQPHPVSDDSRLTSITSALLMSVTKITRYLCESDAQLKDEVEVRGHLLRTMTEQQNLMDALTSVSSKQDNFAE